MKAKIDGVEYEVHLVKDGPGYGYTVSQGDRLVCTGWTQGNWKDGLEEACNHARQEVGRGP